MKNPQKPTRRSLEQLVSLRLTVEDALFIANELKSCASVGAEDPAYLRIPDQIQRQLAKHERKQANAELSDSRPL